DELTAAVTFTGYDETVSESTVVALITGAGQARSVQEGDEFEVVLDRTPFYAESGGQLADHGILELANGARVEVVDVQTPVAGVIVHQARVVTGEVSVGLAAVARVDLERRRSIS